jgi:hypothetical protein
LQLPCRDDREIRPTVWYNGVVEGRPMQESVKVEIGDRAWISWHMLPPASRTDILETLEDLAGKPPESWPARVRPWRPELNLYLIPFWVRNEEVYVFIKPQGERILLEAMYLRELLEEMQRQKTELSGV